MSKRIKSNSLQPVPYNRNINTEDDMVFLFRTISTGLTQTEFIKLINAIHQHGGKVKKDGNVFLNLKSLDKILNDFKNGN
jgi:hypothetical protein